MTRTPLYLVAIGLALGSAAAVAQLPGLGSSVPGLPSLGGMGAGNAAGVLSYCVKNKLVNATSGEAVLGQLTKKPGVKDSDGFKVGQGGTIKTDKNSLSLDNLTGQAKTKMCDAVLKQSKSLL
ncbi:DUF2501 domain-containing protein [Sphingobium sp. AP49]|uniref:DUF2501 domain-containing protein n=1 Tax=Sphingobium sp. AP49 TaxID=1144307 RepID=UPI00026EC88F|nr:DUF2501 domain-containing protein [Sphingobium sp. AP49]WHO40849.1 DUF2501 domain-containing protein [Sphingobium sp. AP49]